MKIIIPYVTTPPETLKTILKLLPVTPGQRSVDLGAGDGRLVIALAEKGAKAYGFENVTKYARRAKANIAHAGLQEKAWISEVDFWEQDLGTYDIVTIYGMKAIMEDLERKLSRELRPGTYVVSNGFAIPGWEIHKKENFVFLYRKK